MKQFKKLGQTTTEYLIILAVVIVIALIVVGIIGGPVAIKGEKQVVDKDYWTTAPVGITSAGISASGNDIIVIKNNKLENIVVNSIEFDAGNNFVDTAITLESGEEIKVAPTRSIVDCTPGQSFSYDVIINYKVESSGLTYTESGHTYSGTCDN